MAAGSIKIRIDGDDSGLQKTLSNVKTATKAGLADIKAGIDMTAAAMKGLADVVGKGVNYNAMIEGYKTSFEVMTGSAEKATEVVERLRKMGASTPFETTDLVKTTQLLMQYGFSADDAIDKMSMLGDISQGNAEAMTSIAMGYAQMSSAGKVNLQDIKQMINGGFNPLQEITERTGESMDKLYERISKGKMSVDEITESMRHATSEGGKFYQSMEKQSQTLNGQLSTLRDNANTLLGSITEGLSEGLSANLLPLANNMIGELQTALEQGGVDGLVATATDMIPDLLGMMTGKLQDAISGLSRWLPKGVSAIMSTLPSAVRGASAVIPQLTTALFDTATLVVNDLIGMLPELVPTLLSGLGNMAYALTDGALKMFAGVIDGVDTAIKHLNQEFITDGIDPDVLKNFDFKIEIDVDSSFAVAEVQTAYSAVRDALNTDLLTDDQKKEILDMLGEDASAIKAKLMEFGLPATEAQEIANTISSSGQILVNAFDDLDLGVDGKTIWKWIKQAGDSKVALRRYAEQAGLSDDDIDKIIGAYNEANGRLKDEAPNLAETIYDTLTDGLEDDEETVSGLQAKVEEYTGARMKEIEDGYEAELAKLDPKAPDYDAKVAQLTANYEQAKTDVQTIHDNALGIVDALAGQSTASVEAAYEDIAALETAINALDTRIEAMYGKTLTAAENAYKVVTAGGRADDATINMAVSLKFTEFKVDEQAAQEQYNAKIAELNEKFAKGDLTKREFDSGVLAAEGERDAAIAAAQEEFERAWAAMLKGIAESEGATFDEDTILKAKAASVVKQMMDSIAENGAESITPEQKSAVSEMLTSIFGSDGFSEEEMDFRGMGPVLANAYAQLTEDMDTSILSGKVQEIYAAALDQGILAGTDFDTTEKSDALAALMSTIYTGSSPEVNAAAKALGEGAADNMGDPAGAKTSGTNTVDGLIIGLTPGIKRAGLIGKLTAVAYTEAYNKHMDQHSPSRLMMKMGRFTGEGLEIGLRESMAQAVDVANSIMGGLNTSADITRMTNVSMPELRQEITIASEQNKVPVNLDGHRIAEIQGQNNASQLAWMRARDARGYGQR